MTKLGLKTAAVILITVGLLVPLALIRGLILERTGYRGQARADVARSWTGAQDVVGPVLVIPSGPAAGAGDGEERYLYVLPETLEVRATLRTEARRRGIYSVPVYHARLSISGAFDLSKIASVGDARWAGLEAAAAHLDLSFSDNRGIVGQPTLVWDGETREFAAGAMLPGGAEGIHAVVGLGDMESGARYPFRIEVDLRGMETLRFAAVGEDTRVTIDAAWPHPSFVGAFLPVAYEIGGERFTAEWRVSGLASGRQQARFGQGGRNAAPPDNSFGVSLIDTVDVYHQALRSVKYGHLIVLLTFTAFFLVEMIRRLMLHPMQYLLVGFALVVFFLLLLALSERMAFGWAYLVSAVACVSLIAVHTWAALRNAATRVGLTVTLGGLYAMLYAILLSEDNALLMGTLLVFSALAAVMLVTRRLDWYHTAQHAGSAGAAVKPPTGP